MNQAQHNGFNSTRSKQRGTIKVLLTGGSEVERAELRNTLAAISELKIEVVESSTPPIHGSLRAGSVVSVLMYVLGDDAELWGEELRPWIQQGGWTLVTAVVAKRSTEAVRNALRAGANEVLFLPLDPVDLARSLLKLSETHSGAGDSGSAAYSLVSVAGGVGVSILTVMLGLALRRVTQRKVALVDLALQSAALSAILDLEPEHSVSELVDPTSSIDSIRLEPVICKHASGLHLLSAPKRIEEGEMVSAATVETMVTLMMQLFDFVLIDCGHHVNEGSVAAWEQSESVLYVLDQSVVSIRCAHRFLDLFARLHLKHVSVDLVLNRFQPSHPITVDKIEAALHRPVAFRIPRDDAAFIAAEAGGHDGMAAPPANSRVALAVEQLAQALLGPSLAFDGADRRGVFSRLLSAMSR